MMNKHSILIFRSSGAWCNQWSLISSFQNRRHSSRGISNGEQHYWLTAIGQCNLTIWCLSSSFELLIPNNCPYISFYVINACYDFALWGYLSCGGTWMRLKWFGIGTDGKNGTRSRHQGTKESILHQGYISIIEVPLSIHICKSFHHRCNVWINDQEKSWNCNGCSCYNGVSQALRMLTSWVLILFESFRCWKVDSKFFWIYPLQSILCYHLIHSLVISTRKTIHITIYKLKS